MKSPRVSLIAFVFAFLIIVPGMWSQAPPVAGSIQDYADGCYRALGTRSDSNPMATPLPARTLDCTTGTAIPLGNNPPMANAVGKCLSPSWAPTHVNVSATSAVPYQCFPGSYVLSFNYTNADQSVVSGALLCKNEVPADAPLSANGKFDYLSLILYNNTTGASCWFASPKGDAGVATGVSGANALNGKQVPDPAAAGSDKFWQAPQATSATNCWRCHDNGVWMNSPWFYVSPANGGAGPLTTLKNAPRGSPYGYVTTNPKNGETYGFEKWPIPVYASTGQDPARPTGECMRCHKIGARQTGNGKVSNTYQEWLGYVTGGSASPVPNQAPVTQDPPGQTPGAAMGQAPAASYFIAHWMPTARANEATTPAEYVTTYGAYLQQIKTCMQAVGQTADNARRGGNNVLARLKLSNVIQNFFSFAGDCHVDKITFPDPPPAAGQEKAHSAMAHEHDFQPALLRLAPRDDTTDAGLTLTADITGPTGAPFGEPITNMPPGAPPVSVPIGSSVMLSWDPGPNRGCSVFGYFPAGVIVPTPVSSDGATSAGSGYNWLPGEGPEEFGPLTEPGIYNFEFHCGFQTTAETTTDTFISLKLVPTSGSSNPPSLMELTTSTASGNVQAVNWISYANPQNSYTHPAVSAGQIPQTNILAGSTDNVLLSWVALNDVPGSCTFSEIGGGTGGLSPIMSDAGQTSVTLGSAASRLFQFACTDLNGHLDALQAKISGVPPIKLNVTTSPSSGVTQTSYVNITGSGLPAGTLTAANVIVNLATSCGGTVVGTTNATSIVPIIGTSDRVQFLIPGLDAGVYYVTMSDLADGDANFSSGNCSMLTVADQ